MQHSFKCLIVLTTLFSACSSDSDDGSSKNDNLRGDAGPTDGAAPEPDAMPEPDGNAEPSGIDQMLAELDAVGLFDNLGQFTPSMEDASGNVTKYWFDVTADSPQCIDSSPFGLTTRDQDSDNLVIYLMGGGACWTNFPFCTTEVGAQINSLDNDGGIGIISPTDDGPTASWNHVFVPYCDGSIFIGDRRADLIADDGSGTFEGDEVFHGLKNLSAALDVAKTNFPDAKRVLLAGSSAGGFGTIWATGLVRKLYPEAELLVFNDAGIGITRPTDPSFQAMLQADWGAEDRFPESCTECMTSVHVTSLVSWGMEKDSGLKVSMFSSYGDDVIAGTFLSISDEEFETTLLAETDKIHAAFPDRLERFFIPGGQHTALGAWTTTMKNGTTLKEWTVAMIEGGDAWTDMP